MKPRKPSEEEKNIGYSISSFYSNKFLDAEKEIEKLKIRDILLSEDGVHIHLLRPGLLIGRRGQNLHELSSYIGKQIYVHEGFDWDSLLNPECYFDFE